MKILRLLPVFLVLSTCSGVNGMGQLMIDAGELLADAGNGNAQTAPRSLTADTDASRLESGITPLNFSGVALVSGPIVMTTLTVSDGTGAQAWIVPEAMACDPALAVTGFRLRATANSLNGFFVRSGQKLCATGSLDVAVWAGYRPY